MSIFNPYVLLGIVLAVLSAFGGGYWKGSEDEITRQQLEIAKLNAEARQKEQALTMAVTQTATALRTSNAKAKQISKERDLAISSGALRLRLPVKATYCPVQTPQIPPLPAEIAVKREPNLTQRLLNLLSPSQTMETKPLDNLPPVSKPTNPSTTP
jgi:hypothetical protein